METDQWICGWLGIGKYIGKSATTAKRYAKRGMPFFRDPGGRPIANKKQIDDYIYELNQRNYELKIWTDEGIDTALSYEDYEEKKQAEFKERLIAAQRPPRSRF